MSDNIDLESNNLCIPEDAFEQFQAISMYQEKEYIILPNKEPVEPKIPDPGDLSHRVYNNEVVVTTENEVNSTVIDSAGDIGSTEQQTVDKSCLETDVSLEQGPNILHTDYGLQNVSSRARKEKHVVKDDVTADSINCAIIGSMQNSTDLASNEKESSIITSPTPRKRGRKPKPKADVSMATSDASYISSTRLSSDPESSDTAMPKRKRGRPKKLVSKPVTSDRDLSSEVSGSDNNRLSNLSSPNNLEILRKGKRGRPRKIPRANLDVQVTHVETTDTLKVSDFNESLELDPTLSKSDVERNPDANNKISSEFSDNDDMDDICLSKLKSAAENSLTKTLELTESNIEYTTVNSPPNPNKLRKPKKSRRGRPKKVPVETSDQSDPVIESAATNDVIQTDKTEIDNDITDDLFLSQLKETENNISGEINSTSEVTSTDNTHTVKVDNEKDEKDINGTPSKRSTKMPIMSDFEYNIDSVIGNETSVQEGCADNSLLVEDTSKRPVRRKIPALRYEEEKGESEEDPFVNMELSDEDDAPRRKKGNKYYSDDEYIPGKREYKDVDSTDSEANELIDASKVLRKKKLRKKSNNQSPRKKGKNCNQNLDDSDDVEICVPPSVVQASDDSQQSQPSKAWGSSSEFENFLAKKIQGTSLQIKKVSATEPTENKILEIPMIDPEAKKTVEKCSQTHIKMVSTEMQASPPYDIPMKKNVRLTSEQSKKACFFLNSIVNSTTELGTLMTQKSEDFIKKKINTSHVTDTFKMDYCVRKSFLLFKLAKHNLMEMEDNLAIRYEEFLKTNNLLACREEQKEIVAKEKPASSDSDCEIVEEEVKPSSKNSKEKPKFNPKTVFLNKELSIKIAKKPCDINKKLDIKGRHTVWINDTVMVKKVKPTQSFLAQDSRNKKPPDNKITTEMVSDFFKSYNRQRVLSVCAPFVTTDWLSLDRECVCNYFVVEPSKYNKVVNYPENGGIAVNSTASNSRASETDNDCNNVKNISNKITSPDSLFVLSYRQVKKHMHDLNHVKEVCHHIQNELTDGKEEPLTLFRLSLRALSGRTDDIMERRPPSMKTTPSDDASISAQPLKVLCHRKVVALLSAASQVESRGSQELVEGTRFSTEELYHYLPNSSSSNITQTSNSQVIIKSLLSLCVEFIQRKQEYNKDKISILLPRPLKSLTFDYVKELVYRESKDNLFIPNQLIVNHHNDELSTGGLTINSINTLSEEAFLNLEDSHAYIPDNSEYLDDFDHEDHNDHFEADYNETEDQNYAQPDTNWVSQVQMKELRSCFSNTNPDLIEGDQTMVFTQIKIEPMDDVPVNTDTPTFVKTEPCPGPDEMTIIPNIKPEIGEQVAGAIQRQNSNSYDVDAFEEFVTANKFIHGLTTEDIYSQSGLRVRRQHEPDYDEENDTSMSLLIPQTYEPLSIENVKGSLMQSSSDDDNSKNKKAVGKKKPDKRSKGKQKKTEQKLASKEPPTSTKEKTTNVEVASLTKRMRDKIRQEEKKDNSSDSESETLPLRLRSRKEQEKLKQAQSSKAKDSEIQCNNVDSTDQVDEDAATFSGFSAIDQNEISTYQKYMKYVYDKIIPNPKERDSKATENNDTVAERPLINPNEPVELLECEPTMPIFDDNGSQKPVSKKSNEKGKTKEMLKKNKDVTETAPYIDRHGWHCYPVHSAESKLYQSVYIALEKLPESFVQTYFQYQGITYKDKNDEEIDRLTNLNSLTRTAQQQLKDIKSKRPNKEAADRISERSSVVGSRTNSPTYSDHYHELEPSDDEGAKVKDQVAAPIVQKQTENTLAKNILMDDNDSDIDDTTVKQEPLDSTYEPRKSSRVRSRKSDVVEDSEDLMLTADKMMNKELTLLHAPVLADDFKEVLAKGPMTRNKQKSATKSQPSTSKTNVEEDSSSEEKKQWVTTKEKLLKRLGKKEDARVDDAKRAKLVSEFIERRTDFPDSHKRSRYKPRRSIKKERFLERQKQLRVLSRELFGESPDAAMSKRSQKAQASLLYKGRRNIRKANINTEEKATIIALHKSGLNKTQIAIETGLNVIDKKSLARSTVVANMEEFERKRRLNTRQTTLRELLGCEEGVNVLVINDEVCLEYDFEANRPVVSVHSFFTKVMKAHQYEGVKFMWDACFESLSVVEAGQPGGGCILAHCMGLGKTLQVLALLHTVLTHPRVGMKRVLVCCPLSTVLNWVDEIHKWIGPVTNQIKVFELSKLKKTYERAYQLEDWYNGGGIFIIGYELFRSLSTLDPFLDDIRPTIVNKIRTALLDPGPDIVVCDEGHLLKNDCSVLAVAMSRVVTKRRIILTGTPMQNNLREYYCMVDFVKPNLLGTYAEYSNRFENPIMNGQHRDSREEDIKLMKARTHILHKVLEGCLQRQEASVLYPYLPKKHEYTVFVNLTKCQWDLYKHYLSHYGNQAKQSILKDFHILQKIWSHPLVLHNFQTKARDERNKIKLEKLEDDLATEDQEEIKPSTTELWWLEYLDGGNMLETLDSSNKFVAVFRILDECIALGDKVLIFSTSLFCLDALEYFLKKINKWSLGQEYYRLDGSVPAEVRQKWCREFNADNNYKTKLFLVSTRAGCLGLNMTAANRVIIMDTSWNPAHDIQSIFRVYRFGQKKDCYIYRLVAMGTMEQKIYERSVTKQAVACRVVDEQQIDRHYNMADLTELYKFDEAGVTVAGGVAVGVLDVALLRVARDAALHAVHEHDSLLRGSAEQGLPEHERAAAWMQFQQEQTHKQIENKLVMEIPNAPLKRLHGHDYTQTQSGSDFKSEDKSEDYQPNEPKAKKGKKGAVIKCCIPIKEETTENNKDEPTLRSRSKKGAQPKPSTSKEPVDTADKLPLSIEDDMVEKITDILLKHNFQNKRSSTEISALVLRVRNIVKKGYLNDQDKSDDLTASIAKVMLPTKQVTPPTATDIICKSIINSAAPVEEQADNPEVITSDPTPTTSKTVAQRPTKKPTQEEKTEPELRTKRKAAIQAEKHIDTLAQDVIINLDDDDWDARDTDFVPDDVDKPDKQNSISKAKRKTRNASPIVSNSDSILRAHLTSQNTETSSNTNDSLKNTPNNTNIDRSKELPKRTYTAKKPSATKREKNSNQVEKATVKTNTPVEQDTSILLSDDEEPTVSKPVEKVKEKIPEKLNEKIPEKVKEKIPEKVEKIPELTEKDEEIVCLPKSLLKNQNFINIVAHTYLVGNPMLDEDAAALAAQYSTLKALKEAESTGRDVCSGPIYDIAVKVIGKDLIKKMKNINPNAASASLQLTEQLIASEKTCKEPTTSKRPESSGRSKLREELIKVKLGMKTAQAAVKETSTVATPAPMQTPTPTSVVPVGLIQSAGISASESFGQHGGECILPDDQNDINSEQRSPPALRPPPEVVITHAKGREPIILNPIVFNKGTLPVRVTADQPKPRAHAYANKSGHLRKILPKSAPPITVTQDLPSASVTVTHIAPAPVVPTTVLTSYDYSKTICLDSDDEDTAPVSQPPRNPASYVDLTPTKPAPPTPSPPVPVSLTMAHAPGVKLPLHPSLQSSSPANAAPFTSKQSLVLKKVVSAGGAQKKYVLVPTDNLPLPILPSSSPADISNIQVLPTTHTPQHQSKISPIVPGEPLVTNKKPDAGNGLRTAKCKPGDILRISQTGQIEIINSNNLLSTVTPVVDSADLAGSTKTVTPPKFASPAQKPPPSIVDLTDVAKVAAKPKPAQNTVNKIMTTAKTVAMHQLLRRFSTSSSDSSRATSPENPLSILKDVVQIRAMDYPATASRSKSKKDTDAQSVVLRTEKCKSSNISVQHIISTDSNSAGKSLNNAKKLIQIPKSKLPRVEAAAAEKQLQKEALLKTVTPYSNKNSSRGKLTIFSEKKYTGKGKQTSLNDGSKSLRITNTESMASTSNPVTVDLTHFTQSPASTLSKLKADVKKRLSSTADVTATKKKKTEPMTLKDFNLDDIDDIIELE